MMRCAILLSARGYAPYEVTRRLTGKSACATKEKTPAGSQRYENGAQFNEGCSIMAATG